MAVAAADGNIDDSEIKLIREMAKSMEMSTGLNKTQMAKEGSRPFSFLRTICDSGFTFLPLNLSPLFITGEFFATLAV